MSAVVRHVIESIAPASSMHAAAARASLGPTGVPLLEDLAARLAGAQHAAKPRTERRTIAVIAGDHGAGDPGISLGGSHPTVIAAGAIADGTAALADMARAGRARIVLVDAGATEGAAMPASVVALGRGPSRNLLREPAMTVVDATLGLEAGIALAMSLAEAGLDVLAVGALGIGSELSAAALMGAGLDARAHPVWVQTRASALVVGADHPRGTSTRSDPDLLQAVHAGSQLHGRGGLELLAAFGGPESAVLAGLILGAASIHIPTILDGHATGAAAFVAATLAPHVAGYLIAAHAGTGIHSDLLAQLGLSPVFGGGLGHGEGIGAAMVLPLLDQVAALAS